MNRGTGPRTQQKHRNAHWPRRDTATYNHQLWKKDGTDTEKDRQTDGLYQTAALRLPLLMRLV